MTIVTALNDMETLYSSLNFSGHNSSMNQRNLFVKRKYDQTISSTII